jgi:tetratricopeptide (TPR) repeat protein
MDEEARDSFDDGDIQEAVKRFRTMVRNKTSNYFDVFEVEGIVDHFLDDGKINLARKAVETGLQIHPSAISLQIKKAQILLQEGKIEECLDQLTVAERVETSNPDLFLTKGSALNLLGDVERAIEAFEKALDMDLDEEDETLYNIGVSFGQAGEHQLAIEYLERAIQHNPKNEMVLYELGYFCDREGLFDKSIEYYNRYLDIDPFNHSVWYNLGITFNRLEQYDKAIDAYDFALALNDEFIHALFNKANALANSNRYNEAIACYNEYLELDKENDDAYCYLAECYLNLELYNLALVNYQKALRLNKENAAAWYGSGLIMWSEGQLAESRNLFKKAIKLENDNPDFWSMYAKVCGELNLEKEAKDAFEMVTRLDPSNVDNWLSYSEMMFEHGKIERAIRILKSANKINAGEAAINYRLTAYLLENKDEFEAACYLEKALRLDFEKHADLLEFYPEAGKIEAINRLIKQYQSTKF